MDKEAREKVYRCHHYFQSFTGIMSIHAEQSGDEVLSKQVKQHVADAENSLAEAARLLCGVEDEPRPLDESKMAGEVNAKSIDNWIFVQAREKALEIDFETSKEELRRAFISGFFSLCWKNRIPISQAAELVDLSWACHRFYQSRDLLNFSGYVGLAFANRVRVLNGHLHTLHPAFLQDDQLNKTLMANVS